MLLINLNQNHVSELHSLIEANRNYLREWLPWLDNMVATSDTAAFIESISKPGSAPHFGVFHQGQLCGVAGFHEIQTQASVGSIGYWLAEPYTGKDIISSAVIKLIELGFSELKLDKLEIRCAEDNLKSRAVAQRLGFVYQSKLDDAEWLYDRSVNHVVYAMLAPEGDV